MLADGLGKRADVMRSGAAADTKISDVHRQRLATEIRDLEAIAGEGVERDRERPATPVAVPVRIAQRLERWLGLARAIGDRQRRNVRLHGAANLLQER